MPAAIRGRGQRRGGISAAQQRMLRTMARRLGKAGLAKLQAMYRGYSARSSGKRKAPIKNRRRRKKTRTSKTNLGQTHAQARREYGHDTSHVCVNIPHTPLFNCPVAIVNSHDVDTQLASDAENLFTFQTQSNNGQTPENIAIGQITDAAAPGGVIDIAFDPDQVMYYTPVTIPGYSACGNKHYDEVATDLLGSTSQDQMVIGILQQMNNVFNQRRLFSKWMFEKVIQRYSWTDSVAPSGWYYTYEGTRTERIAHKADGSPWTDAEPANRLAYYTTKQLSPYEQLISDYGQPFWYQEEHAITTLSPGYFPRAQRTSTYMSGSLDPGPPGGAAGSRSFQQVPGSASFTLENIRADKRFKRIPKGKTMEIVHKMSSRYFDTVDNCPSDRLMPITVFCYDGPEQWMPPRQVTTAAVNMSDPAPTSPTHISDAVQLVTEESPPSEIVPALIARVDTLLCYKFTKRASELNTIVESNTALNEQDPFGDGVDHF